MVEKQHWPPVAALDELGDSPLGVQLLGENLVVWRDAAGVVHAWPDRCPHRGARLSLGRVCGDRLECAYHGWQFDAGGRCVEVPALPGFVPPAGHRVAAHDVQSAYGLLWVRLEAGGNALPVFAAEADTRLRKLN